MSLWLADAPQFATPTRSLDACQEQLPQRLLHASKPRCFLRVTAALDYRQSGHPWCWWVDLETGVAVMSWQEYRSSGAS